MTDQREVSRIAREVTKSLLSYLGSWLDLTAGGTTLRSRIGDAAVAAVLNVTEGKTSLPSQETEDGFRRVQLIINVPDDQGVGEELLDVALEAIRNHTPGLDDASGEFYMGPGIRILAVDD